MGCMDSWFSGKESKRKRRKGPEQRDRVCGLPKTAHLRNRPKPMPMDSYTRESDAAHSAAKGGRFHPPKMPVPPSGPSKQHNSVPRLRFIPAKVVYGSKRLVPSGANPLHH
ncbi:hypothetical protein IEQ34_024680 [Dendrobium chrysotoxum]|uniref:Uncharacterized protein n=1 Tax=Dendrobium chrysotoxum TaxID=161865 RepID=A0AAV7FJB2_DENCH|nr:hypothetical protein IEQ34_024680 [Dendrobium chrysotoxum]